MNSFAATAASAADPMSTAKERRLFLFCAQELNNNAAVCFEKGLFDEATYSLQIGLKLLIAMSNNNNGIDRTSIGCSCCACPPRRNPRCQDYCDHPCTLDGCIAFSEQTSFLFQCYSSSSNATTAKRSHGMPVSKNNGPKKRRLSRSKDVATGFHDAENLRGSSSDGYLYKRPIRVPLRGFCHCHKGYTSLLVVIVFNLAIAHHLEINSMNGSSDAKTENVVYLYKLCLELLRQSSTWSPMASSANNKSSIRCEMIILNNLSQLYLVNGNPTKHKKSLQDLLSSLMVLIERGTRESTGNTGGGGSGSNGNSNNGSSNSSNNRNNYWWDSNRWAGTQNGEQSKVVEGFLENLNPLILHEHCADAA